MMRTAHLRSVACPIRAVRISQFEPIELLIHWIFMVHSLEEQILSRSALVGVVGLGYVGLPLVRVFVDAGFRVLGFDTDAAKIEELKAGRSYIGDVSSEWIASSIGEGKFAATADMSRLREPDAILICVPTPLTDDREPDLQYVEATAARSPRRCGQASSSCLESTTYPGTTRNIVLPILAAGGLAVGRDFFLAYSPERVDPGNRAQHGRHDSEACGRHRRSEPAIGGRSLWRGGGEGGAGLVLRSGRGVPRFWRTPIAR